MKNSKIKDITKYVFFLALVSAFVFMALMIFYQNQGTTSNPTLTEWFGYNSETQTVNNMQIGLLISTIVAVLSLAFNQILKD